MKAILLHLRISSENSFYLRNVVKMRVLFAGGLGYWYICIAVCAPQATT